MKQDFSPVVVKYGEEIPPAIYKGRTFNTSWQQGSTLKALCISHKSYITMMSPTPRKDVQMGSSGGCRLKTLKRRHVNSKWYWAQECDEFTETMGQKINKTNFVSIYLSFWVTGIWPFNSSAVTKEKMAPSFETSIEGHLPLPQSSPVHAITAAIHQYKAEWTIKSSDPVLSDSDLAAMVLQGMHCNRMWGQMAVQQEKHQHRKMKRAKLMRDGLPRYLTGDDFYNHIGKNKRQAAEEQEAGNEHQKHRGERAEAQTKWKK
ncbi:hypothetical protein V8E55_008497 [Tylopilus felleus]